MAKAKDITLYLNIDGKNATATIKNIGTITNQLKTQTFGVGVNLAKWGTIITGVRSGLRLVSSGLRAIGDTVQTFADFEVGMRNVNSIIGASEQVIGGLGNDVLEIQKQLGVTNKDLTAALYQTVSAGVAASDSIEFLTIATKSSVAGITDAEVAVDGLTTVVNAWHLEQKDVNKVADIMFETVKRGKTTFDQIAGSISTVASLSASSGISFEEISAALATMTKQGVPTEQAMTRIQRSIIGMNEVLGDGWADTMTYQEGLLEIEKQAGGSQNKLKDLMGRVEGVNAVLSLTGDNSKMAADDLDAMNNSFGSMETAFREQTKSLQFDIDTLGETINVLVIKTVDTFAPALSGIFKNVKGAIDDVIDLISTDLSDKMRDEQAQFNALVEIVKDHNTEQVTRKKAMDELAIGYGDYLGNLDLEKASLEEILGWQKAVTDEMIRKIEIQAAEEMYADLLKKSTNAQKKMFETQVGLNKAIADGSADDIMMVGAVFTTSREIAGQMLTGYRNDLNEAQTDTKALMEFVKKEGIKLKGLLTSGTAPLPVVPVETGTGTGTGTRTGTGKGVEIPEPPFESMLQRRQEFEDRLNEITSARIEMGRVLSEEEINNLVETNELKTEFFDTEQERNELEMMQQDMMFQSRNQLLDDLVMAEMNASSLIGKMKDAETKDDFNRLKKEHKLQQDKIKMIEAEVDARERATIQMMQSGMNQYNANESIGKQLANVATSRIKQMIAEAVATQIAKAISSIPFPFNIFAAPLAGLAVEAMMEKIIPKFETGGLIGGKRHTQGGEFINAEQGEFIVNREATRGNIDLLEALNAGGSLNVKSMGEGFGGIITAINNQTERLEAVERIALIDPEKFQENYSDYLEREKHTG